jgi:iron complex outermembrane recepter protein
MQRNANRRRVPFLLLLICALASVGVLAGSAAAQETAADQQGEATAQPAPAADTAPDAQEEDQDDEAADQAARAASAQGKTQGVEEIKVTTTMSELTAQNAAVSVTQFSAADIAAFRIQDISDLSSYTPNLEINTAFAASNPTVFIRGIGLKDYNANSAGSVAIYTDGIYVNSPAGQLFQLFDVANIEVLRGPQGSQSARNATSGAIKVYSNKPDGEFSGSGSVTYGNFNRLEFEGAVGFPILGDVVSGRISGAANFMDGYTKNACAGAQPEPGVTQPRCDVLNFIPSTQADRFPLAYLGDFNGLKRWENNTKNWAMRSLVRIQPTDTVDTLLNFHWGQNRGDSRHLQMVGADTNGVNLTGFSEDIAPGLDRDPFVGWYDQAGTEYLDVLGGSINSDIDLGFVHVTSISGYEQNKRLVQDEGDAYPGVQLATDWSDRTWQASQELRVDGDGENYHWSVGNYLLYEKVKSSNLFKSNNLTYTQQNFTQELLTFAPYAHGTWEFNDRWSAELGARYNWERKKFTLGTMTLLYRRQILDPSLPFNGGRYASGWDNCCVLDSVFNALPAISTKGLWAAPTGDFTINYEPVEDVKLYIKYARGMKGGHFNASSYTDDQSLEPVQPEFVHSGEVGIKSVWLDGALGFNSAAFYYNYKDLQVFDIANEVGKPPVQQLLNADATALGVEAEFELRPHPNVYATLGFGWLDARFRQFLVRKQVQPPFKGAGGGGKAQSQIFNFTGNPLIAAPRFNLTGNVEYTQSIGRFGTLIPGVDFSYKSTTSLDPSNKPEVQQPAYWLLNARLNYRTPDERVQISGWVRNITKQIYLVDAFDQSIQTKEFLYVYAEPRMYGVTVSFDW